MNRFLARTFVRLHAKTKMSGELFERQLTFLFKHYLKPGDFVVDGGASYGRHTRVLSKIVGNEGMVFCFEPIPSMVSKLADLRLNNTRIFEIGLSNVSGQAAFSYIPENSGYSGLTKRIDIPGEHSVEDLEIRIDLADSILENRKRPITLIKLDLEGGEFHALLGFREILMTDRSIVLFENGLQETSKLYGYQEGDFFSYFKSINYKVIDCFGQELKTFMGQTTLQTWQFVAFPEEKKSSSVKFATIYALLKASKSVLRGQSLLEFDARVKSE